MEPNWTPTYVWAWFPISSNSIKQIEPNRIKSTRLCSAGFSSQTQLNTIQWIVFNRYLNKFALTEEIVLCSLENTQTCHCEETLASENVLLIFHASFTGPIIFVRV